MTNFESLSHYLDALKDQPAKLAVIPLQLVADHRGVTRASIDLMVKAGRLRAIRIGRTKFVAAESLLELEAGERREIKKVRSYLEELARAGQRSVFYEPVMDIIGLKPSVPADRGRIGWILGAISEATLAESGILLSVLVHRKTAGTTRPGPGFFELAKSFEYEWDNDNEFVEAETDKVLKQFRG